MNLVAYCRVSTEEQGESGLGLAAQRSAIESSPYGASVSTWTEDVLSGSVSPDSRSGLSQAFQLVRQGKADGIIVAKLDRLSRSVADFTEMVECANREGWSLVILDLGVDTTTPNGRFLANVIASVAQLERDLIAQRTRDALAAKKESGPIRSPYTPDSTRSLIEDHRSKGLSFAKIADKLNASGVPTSRGAKCWGPSSVRSVITSGT